MAEISERDLEMARTWLNSPVSDDDDELSLGGVIAAAREAGRREPRPATEEMVEDYLGVFLNHLRDNGPNSAVADNARGAALMLVAAIRESREAQIASYQERIDWLERKLNNLNEKKV